MVVAEGLVASAIGDKGSKVQPGAFDLYGVAMPSERRRLEDLPTFAEEIDRISAAKAAGDPPEMKLRRIEFRDGEVSIGAWISDEHLDEAEESDEDTAEVVRRLSSIESTERIVRRRELAEAARLAAEGAEEPG